MVGIGQYFSGLGWWMCVFVDIDKCVDEVVYYVMQEGVGMKIEDQLVVLLLYVGLIQCFNWVFGLVFGGMEG